MLLTSATGGDADFLFQKSFSCIGFWHCLLTKRKIFRNFPHNENAARISRGTPVEKQWSIGILHRAHKCTLLRRSCFNILNLMIMTNFAEIESTILMIIVF